MILTGSENSMLNENGDRVILSGENDFANLQNLMRYPSWSRNPYQIQKTLLP